MLPILLFTTLATGTAAYLLAINGAVPIKVRVYVPMSRDCGECEIGPFAVFSEGGKTVNMKFRARAGI
jgi:hypothetical protein